MWKTTNHNAAFKILKTLAAYSTRGPQHKFSSTWLRNLQINRPWFQDSWWFQLIPRFTEWFLWFRAIRVIPWDPLWFTDDSLWFADNSLGFLRILWDHSGFLEHGACCNDLIHEVESPVRWNIIILYVYATNCVRTRSLLFDLARFCPWHNHTALYWALILYM